MQKQEKDIFVRSVYSIVKLIPMGRVSSYGAIAKAAGFPNMSRLVGKVLSDSSSMELPAHRVVNSQGILSAKLAFGTDNEMQKRLESEGIVIKKDKVQHWKDVFWNPIDEIKVG